jgi:hypothetical protein
MELNPGGLIATLHSERDASVEQLRTLRDQVLVLEARLADLNAVIEGLGRLNLVSMDSARESEGEDRRAQPDGHGKRDSSKAIPEPQQKTPRDATMWGKKIRSTDMVADLINEAGRSMDREEIISEFDNRFGIPVSWDKPRNALGNALSRAAERGLIDRLGADVFAPRGFRQRAQPDVRY